MAYVDIMDFLGDLKYEYICMFVGTLLGVHRGLLGFIESSSGVLQRFVGVPTWFPCGSFCVFGVHQEFVRGRG